MIKKNNLKKTKKVHFFVDNFLIKLYAVETLDFFGNDFSYYKYILRLKVSSLLLNSKY